MSDFNRNMIITTLQQMLAGTLHLILGCRIIVKHRFDIQGISDNDSVFDVFRGIESETDEWVLDDEARSKVADSRLQNMDIEFESYLSETESEILKACEELQSKLCDSSTSTEP